ncbi:hypothetical protein [Treponema sp. OMZ 855]|uniref:hypothetical protein n=1 Tax=Treponema sp. OMZ 855 TaxID=1643512 RepID=UPI0020A39D6F|nr:hypothetical protein [Treponema sp. OMZ 855]UTC49843.1 hypothetical protein E4N65_06920 [Treponema sp. OMZ 855]
MTKLLLSKPSVVDGIASIIDLLGVYTPYDDIVLSYTNDQKALEADMDALRADAAIAFAGIKGGKIVCKH